MNNHKNILIARTDRIGDVVLTIPIASIIKKHFPQSRVTFLVRDYTKDLLSNNKFIDDILIWNDNDSFSDSVKKIKSHNFDTVFIVNPSFKIALIFFMIGIKTRISTGYRFYSFLFTHKIFEHRKYGTKHELIHNVEMLKEIGISENIYFSNVQFSIQSELESEQKVRSFLNRYNFKNQNKTVIIHPGSGGSAVDFPISHQKELISKLAHELTINLILTGSKEERSLCESLIENKKIINAAGEFNLKELISLISIADIFVANSTGPLHIAAALEKYVIGFYPKVASCSETRWGPFTEKKKVFIPNTECKNCTIKQCQETNCMSSINVDDVFRGIKNFLNK